MQPWPRACITYAVILLTLGVFAQAMALLASLKLIRRNTGNWRLDTFLCQVVGIGAAYGLLLDLELDRRLRQGQQRNAAMVELDLQSRRPSTWHRCWS